MVAPTGAAVAGLIVMIPISVGAFVTGVGTTGTEPSADLIMVMTLEADGSVEAGVAIADALPAPFPVESPTFLPSSSAMKDM